MNKELILQVLKGKGIKFVEARWLDSSNVVQFGTLHPGMYRLRLIGQDLEEIVIKSLSKTDTPDETMFKRYNEVTNNNEDLMKMLKKYSNYFALENMPQKEFFLYRHMSENTLKFVPRIYATCEDNEYYYIIMEDITGSKNLNSFESPEAWTEEDIESAMFTLAQLHSCPLVNEDYSNIVTTPNQIDYEELSDYLVKFSADVTNNTHDGDYKVIYRYACEYAKKLKEYEEKYVVPCRMLIHDDYNIRNSSIRTKNQLIVYDWEFMNVETPYFDIVDFILSLSDKYVTKEIVLKILQIYVKYIEMHDFEKALEYLHIAALKYSATRINFYLLNCPSKLMLNRQIANLCSVIESTK